MSFRPFALLLPVLALGACAAPPADLVPAMHAQRLDPSVSQVAQACAGHHPTAETSMPEGGRYVVTATVAEVVNGHEVAYAATAAPAGHAPASTTSPAFDGRPSQAACGGAALHTIVVPSDASSEDEWVEYKLEVAPLPADGGRLPADAHRLRGALHAIGGQAAERVGFHMAGRDFVAYVAVQPGVDLLAERAHRQFLETTSHNPVGYGALLPDERPGRTLEDAADDAARAQGLTHVRPLQSVVTQPAP